MNKKICLSQLGIGFGTKEEYREFEELIQEELEVRIGMRISKGMSEEMLEEFDRICDPAEVASWLKKNRPDYVEQTTEAYKQMKQELLQYRDRIKGRISTPELNESGILVDNLDMRVDTRQRLKKAGIYTYGEMASIGDLSTVDTLSPKNIREIGEIIDFVKKEGIEDLIIASPGI